MKRLFPLLAVLAFILAACSSDTPFTFSAYDWQFKPVGEARSMWRFRIGDPVTSEVQQTIPATAAQVTDAGLEILLDEWGGNKTATWTGITGGVQDRARIWIDVQDAAAPAGWRQVFSGCLTVRPSTPFGRREAVGDKYLRLRELPVGYISTENNAPNDVGAEMRRVAVIAKIGSLNHLKISPAGLPDANVQGRRQYNGESTAAALDGLISLKAGWGWTTLPDDTLYAGPPPTRIATVNAALKGVQVTFRDVVSEGLVNAVRWVYTLPGGRQVVYESQHSSVNRLGRSALTRYIDQRSLPALRTLRPVTFALVDAAGQTLPLDPPPPELTDDRLDTFYDAPYGLRLTAQDTGDWVEAVFDQFDRRITEYGPPLFYNESVTVARAEQENQLRMREFVLVQLDRSRLDTAAEALYRIPSQHAGTVSVPGIQAPAGRVTIQRPGLPDVSEKAVATRYVIRRPVRTEYVLGEPDEKTDDRVLRVLIDRKDDLAIDRVLNTGVIQ